MIRGVDMDKKGFTLIELLGSIVLLALIALVAFPVVLNFLSSSKSDIDKAKKSVIIGAAKDYVTDNVNVYGRNSSLDEEIKTFDLIEQGYITNKDIMENEELKKSCVKVSINNETKKYQFEYKNSCS